MVRILYVDDDEFLLDICQEFLGRIGKITVDTARSVDEGLHLIEQTTYDAIISDYEMPIQNGIDFLKTLRSRGDRTPFIVFTGRGREEIIIEAFNSGADFYLQKGGEPKSQFAELIHKVTIAVERGRNIRALENSNSLLRATLEATADGILVVDSFGTITIFNQKFLQIWNLSPDTATIKTEMDFLTLVRNQISDYSGFLKPLEKTRIIPESDSYDIVHCRDGRIFRRYSQAQKINENIVGRVWSFRDITGQSRTELELRAACEQLAIAEELLKDRYSNLETDTDLIWESEERYRGIFQNSTCPLLLIDCESLSILDVNAAAAELYGYPQEEILSLSLGNLSAETIKISDYTDARSEGLQVHFHRKKDAANVFLAEVTVSHFSMSGHPAAVITVRDISRTKQIEDALRLANMKLNLLLGITRHDILNHLVGLSGYNEILRTRITEPSIYEILDKQQKAADAIRKQIDFTREYDQLGVKTARWYKVAEIAARAYSQVLQTIPFRCEIENLEIYADPMLEKVFYNLFDNTFRYGEGVTHITLTWTRDGRDLLMVFEDNGIGIAGDEKERIFGRGYGKNTGLGLYLTKEILSITGMTIRETGEFRKGARFEIRIPEGNYRFMKKTEDVRDYGNRVPILADE